jgi:hypothetical protein
MRDDEQEAVADECFHLSLFCINREHLDCKSQCCQCKCHEPIFLRGEIK